MTDNKVCTRYIDEYAELRKMDYCCDTMRIYYEDLLAYYTDSRTGKMIAQIYREDCVDMRHQSTISIDYCPHCGAEIVIKDVRAVDYDECDIDDEVV